MVRKWSTAAATLGALVLLTPVLGIFGLASDSVSSDDNSVASGTFAVASHDIQAARVSANACDDSAPFTDGPITAIFASTVEIGSSVGQADDVCLRNAGTDTGRVRVTFTNVLDTEIGACETSEADAGDTTCADGDAGELADILAASINVTGGSSSASCSPPGATAWSTLTSTGVVIDTDLAPGERCALWLQILVGQTASDTQKLLAQTDQVQWDIVFTLEDIPA